MEPSPTWPEGLQSDLRWKELPATIMSYCQKLVTRVSGGAFGWLFSVLEFDALNDRGDVVRAI